MKMNNPILSNDDINSLYRMIDDSIIDNLAHIGCMDYMMDCFTIIHFYLRDGFCLTYTLIWDDKYSYIDLFEAFYNDWVRIYGR